MEYNKNYLNQTHKRNNGNEWILTTGTFQHLRIPLELIKLGEAISFTSFGELLHDQITYDERPTKWGLLYRERIRGSHIYKKMWGVPMKRSEYIINIHNNKHGFCQVKNCVSCNVLHRVMWVVNYYGDDMLLDDLVHTFFLSEFCMLDYLWLCDLYEHSDIAPLFISPYNFLYHSIYLNRTDICPNGISKVLSEHHNIEHLLSEDDAMYLGKSLMYCFAEFYSHHVNTDIVPSGCEDDVHSWDDLKFLEWYIQKPKRIGMPCNDWNESVIEQKKDLIKSLKEYRKEKGYDNDVKRITSSGSIDEELSVDDLIAQLDECKIEERHLKINNDQIINHIENIKKSHQICSSKINKGALKSHQNQLNQKFIQMRRNCKRLDRRNKEQRQIENNSYKELQHEIKIAENHVKKDLKAKFVGRQQKRDIKYNFDIEASGVSLPTNLALIDFLSGLSDFNQYQSLVDNPQTWYMVFGLYEMYNEPSFTSFLKWMFLFCLSNGITPTTVFKSLRSLFEKFYPQILNKAMGILSSQTIFGSIQERKIPVVEESHIEASGLFDSLDESTIDVCAGIIAGFASVLGVFLIGNNACAKKEGFFECLGAASKAIKSVKEGTYAALSLIGDFSGWMKNIIKNFLFTSPLEQIKTAFKKIAEMENIAIRDDLFERIDILTDQSKYDDHEKNCDKAKIEINNILYILNKVLYRTSLKKYEINSSQQSIIKTAIKDLKAVQAKLLKNPNLGTFRETPYWFYIYGKPGVGKSQINPRVINAFFAALEDYDMKYHDGTNFFELPQPELNNYALNFTDKFLSNYKGQFAVSIDDFAQDAQVLGESSSALNMISWISCIPHPTNQAAIDDKGKPFTSKIVFSTSNIGYPTRKELIEQKALWRRRNMVVEMIGHDEFLIRDPVDSSSANFTSKGINFKTLMFKLIISYVEHWKHQKMLAATKQPTADELTSIANLVSHYHDQKQAFAEMERVKNENKIEASAVFDTYQDYEPSTMREMNTYSYHVDRLEKEEEEERDPKFFMIMTGILSMVCLSPTLGISCTFLLILLMWFAYFAYFKITYMISYLPSRVIDAATPYVAQYSGWGFVSRLTAATLRKAKRTFDFIMKKAFWTLLAFCVFAVGGIMSYITYKGFSGRTVVNVTLDNHTHIQPQNIDQQTLSQANSFTPLNSYMGYETLNQQHQNSQITPTNLQYNNSVNHMSPQQLLPSNLQYNNSVPHVSAQNLVPSSNLNYNNSVPYVKASNLLPSGYEIPQPTIVVDGRRHLDDLSFKPEQIPMYNYDENAARLVCNQLFVQNGLCKIKLNVGTGYQMNAIRLTGTILLLNHHGLSIMKNGDTFSIEIRTKDGLKIVNQVFNPSKFHRIADKDAALYECDHSMPAAKSLINNFPSLIQDRVYNVVVPTTYPATFVFGSLFAFPQSQTTVAENKTYDNFNKTVTYKVAKSYFVQRLAIRGMSGSPLVVTDKNIADKILGIQTSVNCSDKFAIFVPIFRTELEELINKMKVIHTPCLDLESVCDLTDVTPGIAPSGTCTHSLWHLGYLPKEKQITQSKKTKLVKSIFEDCFPYVREPSVLSAKDDRLLPECKDKNLLNKNMQPFDKEYGAINTQVLDYAVEQLGNEYAVLNNNAQLLTMDEIINGKGEHLKGVDMYTSPGWPYVIERTQLHLGGKWEWFEIDFTEPSGKVHYKMKPALLQKYLEYENMLLEGKRPPFVSYACLKDELRKLAKIVNGQTRAFICLDMVFNCLIRKYFGDMISTVRSHAGVVPPCVGINAYADWTMIYNSLKSKGLQVADYDFKGWDSGLHAEFFWALGRMRNLFYGVSNDSKEGVAVMTLMSCLAYMPIINQNSLILKTGGMPSGCSITADGNSLIHDLLTFYVWILYGKDNNKNKEWATVSYFRKHLKTIFYGDDSVMVPDQDHLDFNGYNIHHYYDQLGMGITSAQKDYNYDFKTLEQTTFLKRMFKPDEDNSLIVRAPLDKDSIEDMIVWHHKQDDIVEASLQNAANALREAAQWGRLYYGSLRSKLQEAVRIKSAYYPTLLVRFAQVIPSYEVALRSEIFSETSTVNDLLN